MANQCPVQTAVELGDSDQILGRDNDQFVKSIFDRSLVEAVQGIALSRDNRLPFAQI